MATLRVLAFDGLVPRLSPSLLGENFAQVAENVKLYSKELRFWRGPTRVYDAPIANARTIYRLYNDVGDNVWLMWPTVVDVALGPSANDTESRVYYTGDGVPKKTNFEMATLGAAPYPSNYLALGVPRPSAAPSAVETVVGTGTPETRSYVYTHVSTFGTLKEESKPSDPVTVTVGPTGTTVRVSGFAALPAGSYNITHRRIYRTVVGATTVNYQFVAELPVATGFYDDSLTAAQLGEVLGTTGWDPPPDTMAGIVALPTGALAGFVGNTVYFSEPFFPHAWPTAYAISLPVPNIIGLAVIGSTVVVMTDTNPFLINGGIPGEMYVERLQMPEPCISKATIAVDEDGVVYASPNGLVGISPDQRGLLTKALFTRDEWSRLTPTTMIAAVVQGRYFGAFPNEVPPRAMILSRDDVPALSFMQLPAVAFHVDARNAELFYVDADTGDVMQLDADDANPLNFEWKSKHWLLEPASTFSVLRLDAEYTQLGDAANYEAQIAAANAYNQAHFGGNLMGALNETPLNTFDVNGSILMNPPGQASARSVQVVIYGEGKRVVANLTLFSLDPVRLPPFKERELEFSILGNIHVRSLHMATTMDELNSDRPTS